jgi:1,4-dihydroxy-2-naphthoate octaprenyltransferase
MMTESVTRRFVEFVQLPAKTAGLLPLLLSLFYVLHVYGTFDGPAMLVFFVSLLSFELFITGLNNYVDSKTDGSRLPFARKAAKRILVSLLIVAFGAAIGLVALKGVVVLFVGALCFAVGIGYSYGPFPLSKTPFGEVLSGLFEGFFIPFLVVYINAPGGALVSLSLEGPRLDISLQLDALSRLVILCVPAMAGIAGIMLANNICDVERDRANGRRTLPMVVGKRAALWLFALLYAAAYLAIAVSAISGILPLYALAAIAGAPLVFRNVGQFFARQVKSETFLYAIKNFAAVMVPLIAVTALAAIL